LAKNFYNVHEYLSHFSIGKVKPDNASHSDNATVTTALSLATLGDVTQIEMTLSVLHHPRWPRQVHSLSKVSMSLSLLLMFLLKNFSNVHQYLGHVSIGKVKNDNTSHSDTRQSLLYSP
jgi:hypothetical protein